MYVFVWRSFFLLINKVDPDEMQHYAAYHLGLHFLQTYLFRGFPENKEQRFP